MPMTLTQIEQLQKWRHSYPQLLPFVGCPCEICLQTRIVMVQQNIAKVRDKLPGIEGVPGWRSHAELEQDAALDAAQPSDYAMGSRVDVDPDFSKLPDLRNPMTAWSTAKDWLLGAGFALAVFMSALILGWSLGKWLL